MSLKPFTLVLFSVALVATLGLAASPLQAKSVGTFIDDTGTTAQVKTKLAADTISNLTKIEVTTDEGIVTLNGSVDSPERVARAADIAASVKGVRAVVNNLHATGTTIPPAPGSVPPATTSLPPTPAGSPLVDATGVIAQFDPATGTITLEDGRVVRATRDTAIWQPTPVQSLRPGTSVLVRDAVPVAAPSTASPAPPEWRMGTVRAVDPARGQIMLTDGSLVRVGPATNLRRGADRIAFEQIAPGSEIVIRALPPSWGGSAEGSALPGAAAPGLIIDAADVNIVWMPTSMRSGGRSRSAAARVRDAATA